MISLLSAVPFLISNRFSLGSYTEAEEIAARRETEGHTCLLIDRRQSLTPSAALDSRTAIMIASIGTHLKTFEQQVKVQVNVGDFNVVMLNQI